MKPRALPAVAVVVVAAAILVLMVIPASVWRHPADDGQWTGFDPNLMAISPAGPADNPGAVSVTSGELTIAANPGSHPTVHLITTPQSFSAAFDVEIVAQTDHSIPLRIGIWSPTQSAGYFLLFDHDGGDVIRAQTITGGQSLQDLVGGNVVADQQLARYSVGTQYRVAISVDHLKRAISSQISQADTVIAATRVTPADAPGVLDAFRPSLTLSASAQDGSAQAVVRNFALSVPSQPSISAQDAVKIDDPVARALVIALTVVSVFLCLVVAVPWSAARVSSSIRRERLVVLASSVRRRAPLVLIVALLGVLYVLANAPLFGVASPHFDVVASKIWSYVGYRYGLSDLYFRTILAPAADAWRGVPNHEATFPYGVTKAYYYTALGAIYDSWLSPAGQLTIKTFNFEVLLKAVNVLFGFIDGLLIYAIVRRFASAPSAKTSVLLFALNPALILVMSVWGSTESISIFFVLASVWLAEARLVTGAWLMLSAAAFTRPQMLVLAFLLSAVYLRKFPIARNVRAISWAVVVSFLFIAPFAYAVSPSVPLDYVTRTLAYHIGNGQADVAYLGLSPANFSVWTLPMLFVSGQHGLARMWSPATMPLAGSLTYGQIGAAVSVAFVLGVGLVLFMNRKLSDQPGRYFALVAFGLLGWQLVTPGLISRYMVYAIVTVILCRAAFTAAGHGYALAVLTTIACISIYVHLATDFIGYSGGANVLSPFNNQISQWLFSIASSDWFITLASMCNVAILIVLGLKAWESIRGDQVRALATAGSVA